MSINSYTSMRNNTNRDSTTCKVVVLLCKPISFLPFSLALPPLSPKHPIVVIQKFCYHGNVTVTLLPSIIVGEFPYSNRPSFC